MYHEGLGIPQVYTESVKWFRKAAEQGLSAAQLKLGLMYERGQGEPQDYAMAQFWYAKAAEQDYASAQYNLGVFFGNGMGVPEDYVQAHMWFNLAAARGHEKARAQRDIVAEKMAPADISKAQAMAREWLEKHQE